MSQEELSAPNNNKRQRPADRIHESENVPLLPRDGRLILVLSPEDLLNGECRSALAWNPRKCAHGMRVKMAALIQKILARPYAWSDSDEAALQFITGGPRKVKHWKHLESCFHRLTRSELGLIRFPWDAVLLHMVDDDEHDGDDSSDKEEEDEDVSNDE